MAVRSTEFGKGRTPNPEELAQKYWRTPASSDGEGGIMEMREGKTGHYKLRDHVQEVNKHQWPTPTTHEIEHPDMEVTDTGRRLTKDKTNSHSIGLADVAHYPTPRAQKVGGYSSERFRPTLEQVANGGEVTQQTPKMQLNPA